MGNSAVSRPVEKVERYKIIMMGLYGAGKTSIVYKTKLGELGEAVPTVVPSIGVTMESVRFNDITYTMWDMGSGRGAIRPLVRHHYRSTSALVYVIDSSSDSDRLNDAIEDLSEQISDGGETLKGVPVLVLANKHDLSWAMTPSTIEGLITEKGYLQKHPWCVFGSSVISSEGQAELNKGLEWLRNQVTRYTKQQWYDMHVAKDSTPAKSEDKTMDNSNSKNNTDEGTDTPNVVKDTKTVSKASYLAAIALKLTRCLKT